VKKVDIAGSAADLRGSGHRIDAICSQLITSRQPTSQPLPGAVSLYDNVVVKQEVDDTDANTVENSLDSESDVNHHRHHHHHQYHYRAGRHHSPRPAADVAADKDNVFSNRHSPPHSALAALTDW